MWEEKWLPGKDKIQLMFQLMFQLSDTFLYDMLVGDVLVVLKNLIISTKKESSKSQPVFQYGKKFVEPLGKSFNCFQKGS